MNYTFTTNGPQVPKGSVKVSGAKNAATRLMAAAMLTDDLVTLTNFPTTLVDANYKADFMRAMGAEVTFDTRESVAVIKSVSMVPKPLADYNYPIRTTYLLVPGQLHRSGVAYIPYPGGCKLGNRKHDLHIMVWESLGCKVEETADHIRIEGKLKGGDVHFPISTVGGTENALLCAAVAEGKTVIHNAYITPEIENLIELLEMMGADITMRGISRIEVTGASKLRGGSIRVISDRIEALTWIVFAAMTKGEILIENVPFDLMEVPLIHLKKAGLDYFANSSSIYVSPQVIPSAVIQPFEVACGTHPGVISDMQPFYVLLGLHADGRSKIFDYRYPERTAYVEQLSKIYADSLKWKDGEITTEGVASAKGASVASTDLRGSMAMVMAAFVAEGKTSVEKAQMALRGYDQLDTKLKQLGLTFNLSEC